MDIESLPEEYPSPKELKTEVDPSDLPEQPGRISRWLETLTRMGLGETLLRFVTNALALALVIAVVWLMRTFYRSIGASAETSALAASLPAATPTLALGSIPVPTEVLAGIARLALPHTSIPSRPRQDVIKYTVQAGDTVFGIAEKYGLQPQTILWGNQATLKDDPHYLRPGQELNILPVDGAYYQWNAGDGLNGVADFYSVQPEDIVNFPGNHLDLTAIGDYSRPDIAPGTWLIIPGGVREFVSWSAPVGVTRSNPAIARILGPGSCGAVTGGYVGYGYFVWPTNNHYLSGNDYSPGSNHRGIDLAGRNGDPIFAVDSGVIVYAGWNDYGYGNMIIVDHGTEWQSVYAHLSVINVACGQSVGQGEIIAAMGSTGNSTGPHLHFELMHTQYGKVNPWDFLP